MRSACTASHGFIAQKHMLVTRFGIGQELLHERKNIGRRGVSLARQSSARTKTKTPARFPGRGSENGSAGEAVPDYQSLMSCTYGTFFSSHFFVSRL